MLTPRKNDLLAQLPEEDYQRLLPHLELRSLRKGEVLYELGQHLHHVYFPADAVISLMVEMMDGYASEIAIVGSHGIAAITALAEGISYHRAVVRSSGFAYRLKVDVLIQEYQRAGALMRILLVSGKHLMAQMSYAAVCSRRHTVDQQLVRWLLLGADNTRSLKFAATHDDIAGMIGVRREAVTLSLQRLATSTLVALSRGQIEIIDRNGLDAKACECYWAVRKFAPPVNESLCLDFSKAA